MRSASSITVRMPRSSMSRMVKTPMPALHHIFLFHRVNVAHAHQHAILRLHLGGKIEDVCQFRRPQPQQRGQRHAMHVSAGRRVRRVDVGVRVDPDQAHLLILPAVKFGDARHRSGGHGMISAQRQRNLSRLQRLDHQFRMLGAGRGNLLQIFGVRVAFFFLFRNRDRQRCRHLPPRGPAPPAALQGRPPARPTAPYRLRAATGQDRAARR